MQSTPWCCCQLALCHYIRPASCCVFRPACWVFRTIRYRDPRTILHHDQINPTFTSVLGVQDLNVTCTSVAGVSKPFEPYFCYNLHIALLGNGAMDVLHSKYVNFGSTCDTVRSLHCNMTLYRQFPPCSILNQDQRYGTSIDHASFNKSIGFSPM